MHLPGGQGYTMYLMFVGVCVCVGGGGELL